MKTINTHEAKTHLSRYLADVEKGEVIVITRGSKPVAKLTAIDSAPVVRPKVGEFVDRRVTWTDDAFAPMTDEELKEWGL